jgi:hypothetical protein
MVELLKLLHAPQREREQHRAIRRRGNFHPSGSHRR